MKKPIFKAQLTRKGKVITFQVLEQDDKKIKRGSGLVFKASNKQGIYSGKHPAVYSEAGVYIRGSLKAYDNNITKREYYSGEAKKVYNSAKQALQEFGEWLEYKPKKKVEKVKIPASEEFEVEV